MIRIVTMASMLALTAVPFVAAGAQDMPAQIISGTRLDVVATGEVTRVPDIARISAGVVTQAPTATGAIQANARQMASVRAALTPRGDRRSRHPDQLDQSQPRISLCREPGAEAGRLSRQ